MANIDLTQYGITGTTEIVHNPSYEMTRILKALTKVRRVSSVQLTL